MEDEALELTAHARWRRAIRHPTKWDWSDFLGEALDRFVNLSEYQAYIDNTAINGCNCDC